MSIVAETRLSTERLSTDWRLLGPCTDLTPAEYDEIFFPVESNEVAFAEAKAMCAGCPVRLICLGNTLDLDATDPSGYAGGKNPRKRKVLKRQLKAAHPEVKSWERYFLAQHLAEQASDLDAGRIPGQREQAVTAGVTA